MHLDQSEESVGHSQCTGMPWAWCVCVCVYAVVACLRCDAAGDARGCGVSREGGAGGLVRLFKYRVHVIALSAFIADRTVQRSSSTSRAGTNRYWGAV